MTVDSFSNKLSAYIDGELPEADRAEMERMITDLPVCSAMYDNMATLQERLGDLPELQPSAEFEFGLRSQILLEAARESQMRYRVKQVLFPTAGRSILSGAIAAMLAVGVAVLLQGEPEDAVSAAHVVPGTDLVPASGELDPAQTIRYYDALTGRVAATVPVQPVDRGALKQLSEQESFALSRRLYRARTDSPLSNSVMEARTRPVVQQGKARPVPVSF
jgi:predicted anti-sigma-YlaC factor YlaD